MQKTTLINLKNLNSSSWENESFSFIFESKIFDNWCAMVRNEYTESGSEDYFIFDFNNCKIVSDHYTSIESFSVDKDNKWRQVIKRQFPEKYFLAEKDWIYCILRNDWVVIENNIEIKYDDTNDQFPTKWLWISWDYVYFYEKINTSERSITIKNLITGEELAKFNYDPFDQFDFINNKKQDNSLISISKISPDWVILFSNWEVKDFSWNSLNSNLIDIVTIYSNWRILTRQDDEYHIVNFKTKKRLWPYDDVSLEIWDYNTRTVRKWDSIFTVNENWDMAFWDKVLIFQNKLPKDTLLTSTIWAFKSWYALIYDTIYDSDWNIFYTYPIHSEYESNGWLLSSRNWYLKLWYDMSMWSGTETRVLKDWERLERYTDGLFDNWFWMEILDKKVLILTPEYDSPAEFVTIIDKKDIFKEIERLGKWVFKINGEMKYSKDKAASKYNSFIDYWEIESDFVNVIENDKSITIDWKQFNKKLVKLK